MKRPKVTCPVCAKPTTLNQDDTLGRHGLRRGSQTIDLPGGGTAIACGSFPCSGSGRKLDFLAGPFAAVAAALAGGRVPIRCSGCEQWFGLLPGHAPTEARERAVVAHASACPSRPR